jgi:hypothetical protein
MSVSVVLDVIIGLLVVFFIASSITSTINEVIGMLFARRSNNMAKFVVEMFGETKGQAPNAAKFYNNSVFNINEIGGVLGWIAQLGRQRWGKPLVPNSENVLFIPGTSFSQAIFGVLEIKTDAETTVNDIGEAVNKLPDGAVKDALKIALRQAGTEVKAVTANLEKWFDGQMTQLSEAYKRQQRIWLFVIGLLLAIVFCIDSFAIFNGLQNNPVMRDVIVAEARALTAPDGSSQGSVTPEELKQQLNALNEQLNQLGLPIGFDKWAAPEGVDRGEYTLKKSLGVLVTGIAIALGAPFWFDVIRLLTGRSPNIKS